MSRPTLSQCYRLLEVPPNADLDAVKAAYRRLAFRYHPDLHPGDRVAAERFTRINEAYVTLKRHLERPSSTQGRRQYSAETIFEEEAAKAQSTKGAAGPEFFSARHEEILRDILNDPFAKQVFEDIFRKLRTGASVVEEGNAEMGARPQSPAPTSLKARLQNWARSQLDVHHSMEVPARNLTPGSRLRLSLRLPLSWQTRTIELTLPWDFRMGKPIRLKGLGRRLGPWQGDLYLRLYAKLRP
ncbi:MAG: DnaJ domain-containing protein [Desulfomicrobiaceae bacterium]|jgi:molecular chaperone DnaJ|nr:DnaJ domain-containing protein [Desulfomicrobiaceae bacterium]MDI3493526.1 molecular chaperone DnaJ [Desulfomicrobiaceae bacterium]